MNELQFRETMDTCDRLSGNDLKEYLTQFEDYPIVVSLLSGEEFDDLGIGRTTARSVAQRVYDFEDDAGSLTESLIQCDTVDADGISIDELYLDLVMLNEKSGSDQKDFLEGMFVDYAYPSVVSYAVLSDQSLGFGESTLAKAFDVRDSQPFYGTVADILRHDDPRTSPVVGRPFDPMLAVPESRGEPDNAVAQEKVDGYRCLIHITDDGVVAFSRARNDITESLPELQEIAFEELSGDYILDGEVIAETGSYADTSERIGRSVENIDRDIEMHFKLFDCIVYDDVDISYRPFTARHKSVRAIVTAIDDPRLDFLEVIGDTELAKDEAIANDKEGIIVKDAEGPYEFDKRSAYWQKQKFDAENIDVVITDFHEGEGEGVGTLGAVSIEGIGGVPLGRSGSGFTDEERDLIWNNQDEWLGEVIEVEARGIGSRGKLRMPIFKRHRPEGEADPISRIKEIMKEV